MSVWQVTTAQWLAWARETVAASSPAEALDAWDDRFCRALLALPFGQSTESTTITSLGVAMPSAESMPTMVRGASDELHRGDDDVDAAETLVHGERALLAREPLEVTLESPRGELEVALEPVSEDAQWYIPPLTQRSQGSSASSGTDTTIRGPAPTPVPQSDSSAGVTVPAPPIPAAAASAPPMSFATVIAPPPPPPLSQTAAPPPAPLGQTAPPPPAPLSQTAPPTSSSQTQIAPPTPAPLSQTAPPTSSSQTQIAPPTSASQTQIAPPSAAADREAAAIRTGNTLIPIEPEAANTQTAGVIVTDVGEASEPTAPPPRRPSKVVIAPAADTTVPPEVESDDVLEASDLLDAEEPPPPPVQAPPAPPSRGSGEVRAAHEGPPPLDAVHSSGGITGQTLPPSASRHWSEAVFAGHYTALSRPSSPALAAAEAAFIAEITSLQSTASVIDVGCGEGLHANAFSERGCRTVGLDMAQPMIDLALEEFGPSVPRLRWICRDVRTPGFDETFDLVTCLGTTLGIYEEADNAAVLASLRRLCAPGGRVVIQVANRDYVVPRLPARTWWQGRGCLVLDEVDVNDRASRVQVKRTIVFEDGRQFEHLYSVRVYALHEIVAAIENAGLTLLEVSGSRHTRGRYFGATSADIWLVAARA